MSLKLLLESLNCGAGIVTESGKEFQIAGPADLKPREPKTELTCGTQRRAEHWKSGGRAKEHIGTNER